MGDIMSVGVLLQRASGFTSRYTNPTIQHVATLEAGDGLMLSCRNAETILDGLVDAYLAEGPFVRITPASVDPSPERILVPVSDERKALEAVVSGAQLASQTWKEGSTFASNGGGAATTTIPDSYGGFYDFDALSCPFICAPFACSVDLVTNQPGFWAFDVIRIPAHKARQRAMREYRQTRRIAGNKTLEALKVPQGALDFSIVGTVTDLRMLAEETATAKASSILLLAGTPSAQTANDHGFRQAVNNARVIQVSTGGGALGVGAAVTFYCQL